jgi:hypothetical protein
MPRKPIERFCKLCGKSLGYGTRAKYCYNCLTKVIAENVRSLRQGYGKSFEKWKERIIAGVKKKAL